MSSSSIDDREAELAALQSAFDEYITSSRELEEELDAEIAKMQEKLAQSAAANAALSSQLETIAPQLNSLEQALTDSRSKLQLEERLRRQAEQAQDEAEARSREVEGSLAALREDCDAAHEELAFKESELEETRLELEVEKERYRVEMEDLRSDLEVARQTEANGNKERAAIQEAKSPPPEAGADEDYIKRLEDELELVTEQLIETEQKLSQAQDELADEKTNSQLRTIEEEKKQKDVSDEGLVLQLEEEKQNLIQEESRLREELGLVQEELHLTQEELHAVEEDAKQFDARMDDLRSEHRDEAHKLQTRLDEAETEASTAKAELELLEKTLATATEENVKLNLEMTNLNTALDNAKKDQNTVMEELEAVNQRFDEVRLEAEKNGRDAATAEVRAEMEKKMADIHEQIKSLSDANADLQACVDSAEVALAEARDNERKEAKEADDERSELVKTLQEQLTRTKEDLERKEREMTSLKANLQSRVIQAESNVGRLEKELSAAKGNLAEAEANLIVIRREKERSVATIPKQKPTQQQKSKASASSTKKSVRSSSRVSDESRDDSALIHMDGPRRNRSRSGRARSTSPPTPQRQEYRIQEERKKAGEIKKEYDALKEQSRMGEMHVKRLEEDLKVLQAQLFSSNGDTAVVPQQMSRISALGTPGKGDEVGDVRDVGMSDVEEIIKSGDSELIVDELRKVDQKSAKQREHNAQLLGKILSLQGNIQVFCRVRPLRMKEVQCGNKNVVEALSETEVGCYDSRTHKWKSFGFDRVWGPDQSQQSVFQDVEPLALSVVDGYNACIFAYGQTGSGKTYTMEGNPEGNRFGISYRTIQKVFNLLNLRRQQQKAAAIIARGEGEEKVEEFEFSLRIGMLEIYNDEVYDLLSSSADGVAAADKKREARKTGEKATLDIRRSADGHIEVPGLTKEPVGSIDDVMNLLKRGNSNRATASTDLNEHSSRSHMVLAVDVKSGLEGQPANKGNLYLVDLAGSERVRKSKVEGDQLKEAGFINKSLAALGNVMEALDRKASHVPYRDSKLTYLLQDALGGNSRTMMVVAVCPMDVAFDESIHALQFATRVRRIQLGAAQRNVSAKNLEETVKALTTEMKTLTKAKEKSEHQLHSLKRDNTRIQERLQTLSASRSSRNAENRSMEVLRKNNHEMANRWQKEKTLREAASAELEKSRDEFRVVNQKLSRVTRERDTISRELERKQAELAQATKDVRHAKEVSSAATIRARTAQIIGRNPRTPSRPPKPVSRQPTPSSPTSPTSPEEVARIRGEVLSLLEKHDQTKVDRIDIIMEKFKGKEGLLLDKMKQRYEGSTDASSSSIQRRSEMALARHKERMLKQKESQ